MARDPLDAGRPEPSVDEVCDALGDADCRTILERLDEPMTAGEVAEACDIPSSTTYRKLELLETADLLAEGVDVRPDGHHATRYRIDFEAVELAFDETHDLALRVERPSEDAADRLAAMWGEVRKEVDR